MCELSLILGLISMIVSVLFKLKVKFIAPLGGKPTKHGKRTNNTTMSHPNAYVHTYMYM